METSTHLRAVRPDDLDELLTLCREHAAYEKAGFAETGQVERWREAFFSTHPRLHGWIATVDGAAAGFMTVTLDYATWGAEPFAHMDCLYLRETYRGCGLGRLFLERLAEFARQHGCPRAEWQTPPHNELGIGFYNRMGATAKHKLRFTLDTVSGATS